MLLDIWTSTLYNGSGAKPSFSYKVLATRLYIAELCVYKYSLYFILPMTAKRLSAWLYKSMSLRVFKGFRFIRICGATTLPQPNLIVRDE